MLRADQWMMLGVVVIGGTAAYLLTRTRPRESETPVLLPTSPPGQLPPGIRVPSILRPTGTAGVTRGTAYLGRVELSAMQDPTALVRALQGLGFTDVRLYAHAEAANAPDVFTLPEALLSPSPSTRWFSAIWSGQAAGANLQLPPGTLLLWIDAGGPARRRQAFTQAWAPPVFGAYAPMGWPTAVG